MNNKLSRLLVFSLLVAYSSHSYAQKITYRASSVPVQEVLNAIKSQTGYTVFAKSDLIAKLSAINIDAEDLSLTAFLEKIFHNQNINYSIEGKTIVLSAKAEKSMQKPFRGIVVDTQGKPLPGATVMNMMAEAVSSKTDAYGAFEISAKKGDVLVVSYVGFKIYEYGVNNLEHKPTFQLTSEELGLEELVVVGYGSTRKKDLTGSVASVSGKDLQNTPFMTADNALAGKIAGVEVSKGDGTPGGAVRIRIRGTSSLMGGNDPLYIIDVVPVQMQNNYINPGYDISSPTANDANGSGAAAAGLSQAFVNGLNGLNGLNPEDIESISVLKDASSAAIYGSKAANGVVIITTKRGKNNMKPQINLGYYATATSPRLPQLLNAQQYRNLLGEAGKNSYEARKTLGASIPAALDLLVNRPDEFFGNSSTDWLDEITRNTLSHNAELSIQGGGQNSRYYTSLVYNNTPGVIEETSYQRVAGKINLEYALADKVTIMTNIGLGNTGQNITNGAYGQAVRARPDWSPYDEQGNYRNFAQMGDSYRGFQNPLALTKAINHGGTFSFMGSLSGLYKINPYLNFKSTVSLNRQAYDQRTFTPSYLSTGGYTSNSSSNQAIGSNASSLLENWFIENVLSFNKQLNDKNRLDLVVGNSYETFKRSFFSTTASGYPDDTFLTSLSSAITPLYVDGDNPSKPQSYLFSLYLRGNYSYADKYLFTFTGRTDGSSKFGQSNKWGYFPSGAFAWRISNEKFMKDITWLSDLKIRTSYGLLGNQNIGDQMYRTLYKPLSYAGNSALVPIQLGNSNIKWETTNELDLGADISLFNNRLQFTFDYYDKRTDGALLALPTAPSTAYASILSNSVGIKNTGYELSVDATIIQKTHFNWSGGFNISWNKSLVTHLDANAPLGAIGNYSGIETSNTTLIQGKPLGLITGRYAEGIIRTQEELDAYKTELGPFVQFSNPYLGIGDIHYRLIPNGPDSKQVSSAEIIAEAAPKFYGGFNQSLNYKSLGLQLFFTYSYGGKLLWADHVSSVQFNQNANANASIENRYTPENTTTNMPRLLYDGDGAYSKSNLDVFSSSFLKLRSLVLNYDLGKVALNKKIKAKQLQAFVSATNLFTITSYPGNDPESSNDPYSAIGGYFDASNYPSTKSFSIGMKASF